MKMTKIAAALSLLVAGSVYAEQAAFYSITEVATASDRGSANFGPWALSISGDGDSVSSIAVTSNWYSYFRMAPSAMDLAHRFRYENGCTSVLSSTACGAYLNGDTTSSSFALKWFSDLSANADQTYNIVTTGINSSASKVVNAESTGIITRYSHDDTETDSVGYVSLSDHKRKATVTISDTSLDITDSSAYGFASAYDLIKVGSNYLVVGTAGNSKSTAYSSYCYEGSEVASYAPYCSGYQTQAGFWLTNGSSSVTTTQLASSYYTSRSSDYPYTASAMSITKVGNEYIAVGYSATSGYTLNSTTIRPKNLATFWNLGDGSLTSVPTTVRIFSNNSDNPGTHKSYDFDNSWAVGINENGYIIGNRSYRLKESRNYPTKMFVAKYSSGSVSIVSSEIISTGGVDSEGSAINNNNQVVGWTDERGTTTDTVISSVPRLQEAFLYNITTGNRYAINDLICGYDSSSTKTCVQKGKYYYIEYANDILDDGTILASARRYDSYDDWSTLSNGTNVVVKLSISTAFDSNGDVPSTYVVTNQLPTSDYGASSGSSGGGSFGIWGLLAMAGASVVGQYRRFVKKQS